MLAGTQKPMLGMKLNRAHPLADSLVGCWLFNEGVGNIAYDLSGYDNHGTLTGMAFPSTTASGWNPGRRGSAIAFDGSNDYINCGNDPSLNLIDAITIETWVKHGAVADIETKIFFWHSTGQGLSIAAYQFRFGDSTGVNGKRLIFQTNTAASAWEHAYSNSDVIVDTNWHHYVITKSSGTGTVIMYLDGAIIPNTGSIASTFDNGDQAYIGYRPSITTPDYFTGSIDGVKIYNRALSASEIKWTYREPYAMFERGELLL